MTVNGELVIGYVWWEGQAGWIPILSSNSWPADTNLTTAWRVRNTGDEAATFKVSFMELESDGILLNPEEEADLYLYPVTPSPGTYSCTLQIIADSQVIAEYPIGVTTAAAVVDWTTVIAPLLVLGLMAGMVTMMAPMMKEGFS